jgi:MFS family permease
MGSCDWTRQSELSEFQMKPSVPSFSSAEEDRVYAKVTRRLLPFLFIIYVVDYLDRVNISYAKLQMMSDLGWTETMYGWASGTFFLGYCFFEVPSNLALHKIGAKKWIALITVAWGIASAGMMFVTSPFWICMMRFLLGAAEAGYFPGVILYLTYWYPKRRRGAAVSNFMTAMSVSGLVGGPVSGWIMHTLSGAWGLRGWQWLFVLEGTPAILLGIMVLFYLNDSIRGAHWLNDGEKALLERNIAGDAQPHHHTSVRHVLADGKVWLCGFVLFLLIMGLYGISFWLPQLIKNAGVTDIFENGLLSAIPYIAATGFMVWLGRSSDRHGERHAHIAISAWVGAVALASAGYFGHNLWLAMIALTIAAAAIFAAIPLMVALPTEFFTSIAAAGGIALINSIGNLAGLVNTPLLGKIKDLTGRTDLGLYLLSGCLVLAGIILMVMRARHYKKVALAVEPVVEPI